MSDKSPDPRDSLTGEAMITIADRAAEGMLHQIAYVPELKAVLDAMSPEDRARLARALSGRTVDAIAAFMRVLPNLIAWEKA